VFTFGALAIGALTAVLVGLSKTALPGAALIATPLVATVVSGRALPGTVLPILLVADLFAITWYREHARWDLLRGLALGVAFGFVGGMAFFVAVGSGTRAIDVVIGLTLLVMISLQAWRLLRASPPKPATRRSGLGYGAAGGFTTFVSNSAGPVMNTYLAGLGLDKHALIGTSAWFYFAVNVAKIPLYLALGAWSDGGAFFTAEGLAYAAVLVPFVLAGVYGGRAVFHRIPQRLFLGLVLAFAAIGAVELLRP
jgi:uncharacterized membrane protein YfcA